MNPKATLSILFVVSFLFLIHFNSMGQSLLESPTKSPYTYIYRITESEAHTIYRKGRQTADYLNTLVDSFPTGSSLDRKLPHGHYIKTFADGNQQKFFITSVHSFDVMLLTNYKDLTVRVYDTLGGIIKDARVRAGSKTLQYDKDLQAYVDKKSNRRGLLTVEYKEQKSFYDLTRQRYNPALFRGTRFMLTETPLKYAWRPVEFAIFIPVDIYKSLRWRWTVGTIRQTNQFFARLGGRVACAFDDYYCDDHYERFERNHQGYMVFNKPKYQPGDTVKLKAFIVNRRGKPVADNVEVVIYNQRKRLKLGTVSTYNPGGFSFEFFLHDSLQLQLDKDYQVNLEQKPGKNYISGRIRYEDYEYSGIQLSTRTTGEKQYRNLPFYLYAKGTDENDLQIMDGRLEIFIIRKSVEKVFSPIAFLPDTIMSMKFPLDYNRETSILIPDSIMPQANFEYEIQTRLLTASNEVLSNTRNVKYFFEKKEFEIKLLNDSLRYRYLENGIEKPVHAIIYSIDNFKNNNIVYEGLTPASTTLSPYYSAYQIEGNGIIEKINIADLPAQLSIFTHRTKDSLQVRVNNPLEIPFSYHLYKQNRLLMKGYSHQPPTGIKARNRKNYFLGVQYLWGGRIINENYRIGLNDDKLTINTSQPGLIYPGQKTTIDIVVTDIDGKPVEGVDITAQGLTSKFQSTVPNLPFTGNYGKPMRSVNRFYLEDNGVSRGWNRRLDFNHWSSVFGLDSVEYYRFLYPDPVYRFEYDASDEITQFAPFVLSHGKPEPIYVIYVDNRPVWFSFASISQPWSFRIAPGKRHLRIRTRDREYVINNLLINSGKKLILSIDKDISTGDALVFSKKYKLDPHERRLLSNYLFVYRNPGSDQSFWLINGDNILRMSQSHGRSGLYRQSIGPVAGDVTFESFDQYKLQFRHEPGFEYEFAPGLLKMRTVSTYNMIPERLLFGVSHSSFREEVITRNMLVSLRESLMAERRNNALYQRNPGRSIAGNGDLNIRYNTEINPGEPENILIFRIKDSSFFRLYRGNTRHFVSFQPGNYRVVFLYPDRKYHSIDINILANGFNSFAIDKPAVLNTHNPFNEFRTVIMELKEFQDDNVLIAERYEAKERIKSEILRTENGSIIRGYVYDVTDGSPLIGVSIFVKGTRLSTFTDIDGYYEIQVPEDRDAIFSFSYIGYITKEIGLGSDELQAVFLSSHIMALDEIVVVGYGTKQSLTTTASVQSLSFEEIFDSGIESILSLQGRVAGVSVSGAPEYSIRGMSSVVQDSQLFYVIDGIPYMGDPSQLDPSLFANIEILKGNEAMAIYGARASNGAILLSTGGHFLSLQNILPDQEVFAIPEFAGSSYTLRTNFSDYAFWQPRIITDKQGKASFEVTFPDDITSWDTYYLAMNGKRQTGKTSGRIRSYLPLSAQLALPRFLIQSDTALALGKVFHYLGDSVQINTKFLINDSIQFEKSHAFLHSAIDSLLLIPSKTDSLKLTYTITREDGYFDGEERFLAVYPPGLMQTEGIFHVFNRDTVINIDFKGDGSDIRLYARASLLNVLEEEIESVINFRYYCNEQIASRIKALVALKMITEAKGERFTRDIEVNRLIRRLQQNQSKPGMWGWWKDSEPRAWVSLHALEALMAAAENGFETTLLDQKIAPAWVWEFKNASNSSEKLDILKILLKIKASVNFEDYISKISDKLVEDSYQYLQLIRLKQMLGIDYDLDTIWNYKKESLLGDIWFSDKTNDFSLLKNDIQTTLIVHDILSHEKDSHNSILLGIRNYFISQKRTGFWRNTYESSRIIETIVPAILKEIDLSTPTELVFSGDLNFTISEFPFEMNAGKLDRISVAGKGNLPVYFTAWQTWQNTDPEFLANDLQVLTHFLNEGGDNILAAGQETILQASVKVLKEAEFAMITIPIPAGCSYSDSQKPSMREVHREYFRNEVVIFCENLPIGDYTFDVQLIPRYAGNYNLNPAQIKLMYFPVFNANESMKRVRIN